MKTIPKNQIQHLDLKIPEEVIDQLQREDNPSFSVQTETKEGCQIIVSVSRVDSKKDTKKEESSF